MTRAIVNPFFDHDFNVTPDPDVPNLYRHYPTGLTRDPMQPNLKITELITVLLKKRPDWVFLMSKVETKSLQVYTKDKEHLGSVEFYPHSPYYESREYFQLHNFRIAAETTRSTGGRCYSVSKAADRIVAKFRPLNLEELAQQRMKAALDEAHAVASRARSNWLLSGRHGRVSEIGKQVLDNPEPYLNTPVAALIEELRPHWLAHVESLPFGDRNNFDIVTEIERDGIRQLYNITATPHAYWLDAEQHAELISKVAMLRMVDVGQVVPGIGFRSEDHTFVILS
jgi:hypothetical protein